MKFQNVQLDGTNNSSLDIYQSNTNIDLPGIVIVGGGSYKQLKERDTERVALKFVTQAFQTFVVRYPTEEHKSYPDALEAIDQSFEYIYEHAQQLQVDVAQLGIIGFSAGGQLAADYSNQADTKAKFVLLGYPVIRPTLDEKMGVQTRDVAALVSSTTPPTIIWGSVNDELTPYVEHIQPYAQALAQNKVPFEVHEFGTGNHGIALADPWTGVVNDDRVDLHMSCWFYLAVEWLHEVIGIRG